MREWGGAGPAVLLAHGMAANGWWWEPVVTRWNGSLHAAALDFRGHGDSERAADGVYTRETWIEDIETARRALGWERMILCGHSMGARIVLQYAARHPTRVRGVVALDFLPEVHKIRTSRFARARGRPQPVYQDEEQMMAKFRLEPDGTRLDAAALRELGRRSVRPTEGGWTWKFDWRALGMEIEPIWDQLSEIPVPALIVRGAESTLMSRADAERVARAMPHARTAEIPGAFHHVTLDNPDAVARTIADFAASLPA